MVYCDKCGAKNEDESEFCSNCGAELKEGSRKRNNPNKRQRDECFGLPYGGLIVAIIFGILLVLFGLSSIFGFDIWAYVGPFVIIIVGILIVLGAIYKYSKR